MNEDLGARIKTAISIAERNGGKAHHVRVDRDGHISATASRIDAAPMLARAFPVDPPPEGKVSRGAIQQGEFDELLAQLPERPA